MPAASSSLRAFRSAPAQKARSPTPVSTTARTASSEFASTNASISASPSSGEIAFIRSGRLIVRMRICPLVSLSRICPASPFCVSPKLSSFIRTVTAAAASEVHRGRQDKPEAAANQSGRHAGPTRVMVREGGPSTTSLRAPRKIVDDPPPRTMTQMGPPLLNLMRLCRGESQAL